MKRTISLLIIALVFLFPIDLLSQANETIEMSQLLRADGKIYVVLAVIDEPQKPNAYGSTVALPVAKKIIETLLVIEQIPPSIEKKEHLAFKS